MQVSRPKILIVDDEKIIRDGCNRILSKENIEVHLAENGEMGLEKIRDKAFDCLLLDLMMPGLSGMQVLDEIRKAHPELIVIVITGYATVENAVEAMKRGAYDFIAKPFTPDQLRLVVRRALEKIYLIREAEMLRLERERSLRDIATEKSRITTIISCMADGVLVVDREGNIVLNNPAVTKLLDIGEKSIIGKPLLEGIKDDKLAGIIEGAMNQKEGDFRAVSQEVTVDGKRSTVLRAHAAPVSIDQGDILGCVIVLQDITGLKELDQMKSDFVAMVSHELRSPLSAIYQQLGVIQEGLAGDVTKKQEQLIGRAKERTNGLLELIENLLDISKIEAGRIVQQMELLQLSEILEKLVDFLSSQAEKKGIAMGLHVSTPLPPINADRQNMEEVFNNLIQNAITYTPSGGKIEIRSGIRGEYVKIEVADTGIGIAAEDLPKIWDRFFRVKNERTRQIVGTGLGLPIVKGIVEAHLGSIEVESELDVGSTFTVHIPKASAGQEGAF